jgi:PAS domain S-box-containing protein
MSIRARTYLLVVLPLAGLTVLAAWGWMERSRTLAEIEPLVDRVELLTLGGELVHALQSERGRTAAWLEREEAAPGPTLLELRQAVDARADAFRGATEEVLPPETPGPAAETVAASFALLDSLAGVRSAVDRRAISGTESTAFFTRVNEALLDLGGRLAQPADHPPAGTHAAAYSHLIRLKEAAGIERGILTAALTRGVFLPGERDALIIAAAGQRHLRAELAMSPDPSFFDAFEVQESHDAATRARELLERALDEGPDAAGLDADEWYSAQSARIEGLRDLERAALAGLDRSVTEVRAQALRERRSFALAGLAVVLLTLTGASLSAGSIRKSLADLREALERVGTEGGVRGSRLDERAPAELAAIAHAFNQYAERAQGLLDRVEASEARFAGILEISVDAIISTDEDQRIILFNRGAEHIFGYTSDEMVGRPLSELIPERHRPAHREHVRRFGESPVSARRMGEREIVSALRKNGEEFPAEASISKLESGGERIFTVVLQDVTERKRQEEALARYAQELARSNSELEQFAYVASHDLQEPLRMVASYTQLLARRYEGRLDEDADEFIGYAVEGVNRMRELINGLLTYSRVGRGEEFEPTDLGQTLDRALANLRMAIEESGAAVTSGDLPTVHGDALQLTQLFQNLVGNALRFRNEEAPRVHVEAEREEDTGEWLISVMDNGIGMDPESLDRIFLIFQRLKGRRENPGTGIGLAIARKIVERHGGRIWAESEPGRGSTFRFTIPNGS